MDVINWIIRNLVPTRCSSEVFIYNDMESQSDKQLPIIYVPFDARKPSHWADRGLILDFVVCTRSTRGEGKKLLDLGPGDGWPSLGAAEFADEVVGLDASPRRVEVCTENARRLGIANARFVSFNPGDPFPFEDESFDGVMAASSVEQTPDPKTTLKEIHRVLRPGGRLRMYYEGLETYRGGNEREVWVADLDGGRCRMILYVRDIDGERVDEYGITFSMPGEELKTLITKGHADGAPDPDFDAITVDLLQGLHNRIIDARVCSTTHPSGRTYVNWLKEIGFSSVVATHNGGRYAGRLLKNLPEEARPATLPEIDAMLMPALRVVTELPAPLDQDPMITAVK